MFKLTKDNHVRPTRKKLEVRNYRRLLQNYEYIYFSLILDSIVIQRLYSLPTFRGWGSNSENNHILGLHRNSLFQNAAGTQKCVLI